jgi:hypothetical protein
MTCLSPVSPPILLGILLGKMEKKLTKSPASNYRGFGAVRLRIPAGSRWNSGLQSASLAFVLKCSIAKRESLFKFCCASKILVLWSQMDVMYFTRHVVSWHASTCQSLIGSYRLLDGNTLTRGTLTRGSY